MGVQYESLTVVGWMLCKKAMVKYFRKNFKTYHKAFFEENAPWSEDDILDAYEHEWDELTEPLKCSIAVSSPHFDSDWDSRNCYLHLTPSRGWTDLGIDDMNAIVEDKEHVAKAAKLAKELGRITLSQNFSLI